jgi:hypothetical protein
MHPVHRGKPAKSNKVENFAIVFVDNNDIYGKLTFPSP